MKTAKKISAVILSVILLLNGCTMQNLIVISESETGGEVSRAQYVQMIYDNDGLEGSASKSPYFTDVDESNEFFNAIQSCYEWGYIEQTNESMAFHPENSATNGFAVIVAVNAIGIDIINASGYSVKNGNDSVEFFYNQTNMDLDMEDLLTAEDAETIISSITTIKNSLTLNNQYNVTYADNAYQINADSIDFAKDGKTATVNNAKSLKIGDYLVVEGSKDNYSGKAIKINTIADNVIEYEDAELTEVLNDVLITGESVPEIVNWKCDNSDVVVKEVNIEDIAFDESKDVQIVPLGMANKYDASQVGHENSVNIGDKAFELTLKPQKNCKVTVKLALTNMTGRIYFDANIAKLDIKRLQFSFSSVAKFQISVSGDLKSLKLPTPESPVGLRIEATFFKIIGIGINFKIKLKIGGTVSVVYSVEQTSVIDYKKGALPKYIPNLEFKEPELKIKAKASLTGDLSISPDLLTKPITDIGIEGGIEATADINKYLCSDINAYIIARGYVGSEDSLCVGLGLSFKRDIITKENSPFNKKWHIEDGNVVKRCTRTGFVDNKVYNKLVKKLANREWFELLSDNLEGTYILKFNTDGTVTYTFEYVGKEIHILSYEIKGDDKIFIDYLINGVKGSITIENIDNSNLVKYTYNDGSSGLLAAEDMFTNKSLLKELYNSSNSSLRWTSDYFKKAIPGFRRFYCDDGKKLMLETENGTTEIESESKGNKLIFCHFEINDHNYNIYIEKYSDTFNAFIKKDGEKGIVIEQWRLEK